MESNSAAEVIDDAINDSKMPELELPKESVLRQKTKSATQGTINTTRPGS